MKYYLSSIAFSLAITITACASTEQQSSQLITGEISTQEVLRYDSFSSHYNDYQLSQQQLMEIDNWPQDLSLTIYFGTWCHDSQREVPKFLKLFSYKPSLTKNLIALDYQKSDPAGLASDAGVKYTPTIVVKKGNTEIGRIIERPKRDIVTDITKMLTELEG